MRELIPVYEPSFDKTEREFVLDCIDSGWISGKGKYIKQFEQSFAEYINTKFALTVSNGTVALHLALSVLGIRKNDEVIVPTFTYIATVNAIKLVGAKPVFVDSLRNTWQMDPIDVKNKISNKTKAIMAVHLYGHPCDMTELSLIAKNHQLFLIEDCSEAIGSKFENKHVGTFGDIATFSFYGNKTITTGEGGMVVTNDENLYEKSLKFKNQGISNYKEYWHDEIGFNYRMTNICAAIGLAQLTKINHIINRKYEIAQLYKNHLTDSAFEFHHEFGDVYHSYWMCSILVPNHLNRDIFRSKLKNAGIETRPTFYPVHLMPMYSSENKTFPVAEELGARGINLPSFPTLKDEEIFYITKILKKVIYEY